MKLNELMNVKRAVEMPLGKNEVVFDHIDYRIDKITEDITGIFVHVKDYRPLFLPFFENGQNFQLDLLLDQLGCENYAPDEINKYKGTKITVHRYIRKTDTDEFTNVSFNANYSEEDTLA